MRSPFKASSGGRAYSCRANTGSRLVSLCSGTEAGRLVLQGVQAIGQATKLILQLLDMRADFFKTGCCLDKALVVGQCRVKDLLLQSFALALEGSWLLPDRINGIRQQASKVLVCEQVCS